jgi:hypothetical protein
MEHPLAAPLGRPPFFAPGAKTASKPGQSSKFCHQDLLWGIHLVICGLESIHIDTMGYGNIWEMGDLLATSTKAWAPISC